MIYTCTWNGPKCWGHKGGFSIMPAQNKAYVIAAHSELMREAE